MVAPIGPTVVFLKKTEYKFAHLLSVFFFFDVNSTGASPYLLPPAFFIPVRGVFACVRHVKESGFTTCALTSKQEETYMCLH